MTNPYDGRLGYNRAVDDAIRVVSRVVGTKNGDAALAVEIVVALSRLYHVPRVRRWAKRPTELEVVVQQAVEAANGGT